MHVLTVFACRSSSNASNFLSATRLARFCSRMRNSWRCLTVTTMPGVQHHHQPNKPVNLSLISLSVTDISVAVKNTIRSIILSGVFRISQRGGPNPPFPPPSLPPHLPSPSLLISLPLSTFHTFPSIPGEPYP